MKSKFFSLVLGCSLLILPAAIAAETANPDPYTQAVATYITAAGQQLHAIRNEVDAVTKNATDPAVKQRYVRVYAELDRSARILDALKTAETKDFDRLKAEFELTRDKMVKVLDAVRRGE